MDPVQKIWMFQNWIQDEKDSVELAKNHAYLLGSFWNPEAVKQLTGEGAANTISSTDEDFEESTRLIREGNFSQIINDTDNKLNSETNISAQRRKRKII